MASCEIERERFIMAMESEGMSRDIARRILRHANTVQRLAVANCNVGRTAWQEKQEARAERLIREWCAKASHAECACEKGTQMAKIGCRDCVFEPVFSGDPRGACVKLRVPSGKTDDWGQTGICVPTRRY